MTVQPAMNTASCTIGWVNYVVNEPSQAAVCQDHYDVIRLTHSKEAVWTVDDVARLMDLKKNSYLFTSILGSI